MFNRRTVLAGAAAAAFASPIQALTETSRIEGIVSEFGFNGVVLLGENGHPNFQKAYGVADAETGRAASPQDR
ncbi:MAG: hypothetical protein Q8K46_04255, partial [Deltaproteobacteria bacterium]|nr:hypothetical protein [Deltaproteobacteria bacterium]